MAIGIYLTSPLASTFPLHSSSSNLFFFGGGGGGEGIGASVFFFKGRKFSIFWVFSHQIWKFFSKIARLLL